MDELRKRIKKLFAQYGYDELINHLVALFPQWISVDDRLPERGIRVLTYNRDRTMDIDLVISASAKHSEYWLSARATRDTVTHWQPLPQPPKEQE